MRWALALQKCDYTVKDIPGKDNAVADYLSRLVVDSESVNLCRVLKFGVRSDYVNK